MFERDRLAPLDLNRGSKMVSLLAAFARGSAVVGAIFLIVALLKQLIVAVGLLVAIIKFAIILVFVAVLAAIAFAIYRDHQKRKSDI